MSNDVFHVAANGRYFERPGGGSFMPVGINAMEELMMQYGVEARYWADHEVEGYLARLSSCGANFLRLQTSVMLEEPYFKTGTYHRESVRRMDLIMDLAEQYGIAVYLELFCPHHYSAWFWPDRMRCWNLNPYNARNGGPIAYEPQPGEDTSSAESAMKRTRLGYDTKNEASMNAQKARVRWFVERYGGRPSVFCWGLSNDFPYTLLPEVRDWLLEMADFTRAVDSSGHMVTLQTVSKATWPEWMVDVADFTSIRAYPWSGASEEDLLPTGVQRVNPLNLARWLDRKAKEHIPYGKPIINGEYGGKAVDPETGDVSYTVTPQIQKCTLYGLWASLAAGASPGHRWCGWDGFFPPTEKEWPYLAAVARFCNRIDWARFDSRNCDDELAAEGADVYGCRDERLLIAWLVNQDWQNRRGPLETALRIEKGLPAGRYLAEWIDPATNRTLQRVRLEGPPFHVQPPSPVRDSVGLVVGRIQGC